MKNSIVLVPYPFDDFSAVKVRPALCLTSGIGNFNHVIVAFISSNTKNNVTEYDILLKTNTSLSHGTGLHTNSVIKLYRIATIPQWLIKRKLGEINQEVSNLVEKKLKRLFEIEKI